MRHPCQPLLALALTGWLSTAGAVTPQPEEFLACKTWSEGVFPADGETGRRLPQGALRRRSGYGGARALLARHAVSARREDLYNGLAFNSTKHILVHLGKPPGVSPPTSAGDNDDTRQGETQATARSRSMCWWGQGGVYLAGAPTQGWPAAAECAAGRRARVRDSGPKTAATGAAGTRPVGRGDGDVGGWLARFAARAALGRQSVWVLLSV